MMVLYFFCVHTYSVESEASTVWSCSWRIGKAQRSGFVTGRPAADRLAALLPIAIIERLSDVVLMLYCPMCRRERIVPASQ